MRIYLICYMTLSACPSFALILVPGIDALPIAGMGILLAGAVTLDAHIGVRMTRLARLQIPPHFRGMIRIPVIYLRAGARLAVGFDFHVALFPRLGVAVRTEFRLVAAIAVLGIIRRLYGMDGDKIGPMRPGHVLPSCATDSSSNPVRCPRPCGNRYKRTVHGNPHNCCPPFGPAICAPS